MTTLLVAIHPHRDSTRLLVMSPSEQTLLKARLLALPRSRRALPLLLEGLALWQDRPVRAVLVADEAVTSSGMSLSRDFGDETAGPLYMLKHVPGRRRPRGGDELRQMGHFADLWQLLCREAAR